MTQPRFPVTDSECSGRRHEGYQVVSGDIEGVAPSSLDYESFRPSNLPPKSRIEAECHIRQVRELEICYRNRLQRLAVDEALVQMKRLQRDVSAHWLSFTE